MRLVSRKRLAASIAAPMRNEPSAFPLMVTQMIAVENLAYGDAGITLAAVWNGAVAQVLLRVGGGRAERDQAESAEPEVK